MVADPFCSPDEISGTIFYSSRRINLLYDIKPVVRGHVLFVTKRHVVGATELSEEEIYDIHKTLKFAVPKITRIYGDHEASYNLTVQVGRHSGRTVDHFHMHMIPRNVGDRFSRDENVYDAIKNNSTHFSIEDVRREVAILREEFGYKQG